MQAKTLWYLPEQPGHKGTIWTVWSSLYVSDLAQMQVNGSIQTSRYKHYNRKEVSLGWSIVCDVTEILQY